MNRTDRLYAIVEELAPARRAGAPRGSWPAISRSASAPSTVVAALRPAGVPIYSDTGRSGGYALDKTRTLPPMNLSPAEAVAVGIALGQAAGSRTRAPRVPPCPRSSRHVGGDSAEARQLAARIQFLGPEDGEGPAGLGPLGRGGGRRRRQAVRLTYRDRNGAETRRDVEPVAFISARDWYLIGWCRLRGAEGLPHGPRPPRVAAGRGGSDRDFGDVAPRIPDLVRTRSNWAEIRAGTPT